MMAFPALMEIILLYIAVEVGLVDGIRAVSYTHLSTVISGMKLTQFTTICGKKSNQTDENTL